MKLRLAPIISKPLIDLCGGRPGTFSGPIPNIQKYYSRLNYDAILIPHDLYDLWGDSHYLNKVISFAEDNLVFLFNRGDFPKHLCHPNIISIQVSAELNLICPNHKTMIVPYNVKNIGRKIRKKEPIPTISFIGYSPKITFGRIVRSLYPLPPKPIRRNGALVRKFGIHQLNTFEKTLIVQRDRYSATAKANSKNPNLRRQFEDSILNSDMVFCPRGDANNSQRFYETLLAGKIPIIPDTGIVYPKIMDEIILSMVLSVKPSSADMRQIVYEFWKAINPLAYINLQNEIRAFSESKIDYYVFFSALFSSNINKIDKYII